MNIQLRTDEVTTVQSDALLILLTSGGIDSEAGQAVDAALNGALTDLIDSGDFSSDADDVTVLYSRGALPAKRIIVVGLGVADDVSTETVRRATAVGLQKAHSLKVPQVATVLPAYLAADEAAQSLAEGALLGLYQYHGQKSSDQPDALPDELILLVDDDAPTDDIETGLAAGRAYANGTNLARELANLPPNICTPSYMAEQAQAMAKEVGLTVKVLERQQMKALKMGALLGVAQGSETPPRFIILEHNLDVEGDTIVLVGKGVTFDTGGYSLKSKDGMIGMKGDMSGGAAVLGAMRIIGELNLPISVVGLVPASDNMVSGKAYRPQDVVTASNGKTIEIISTDAEGRLLLADALVYAKRYDPAAVVDIATLTGSMLVALGHAAAGFYCTDDAFAEALVAAGDATQERVWRMPMFEEYGKSLESDTADTKNSGGSAGRAGGAGVAAHFLSNFVDYPAWAHIDMAGMMSNQGDNPYKPGKGGSGYGARLMARLAQGWSEEA